MVRKTDRNLKPTRTKDLDMSVKGPRSAEIRLLHPPAAKRKRSLEMEPQQQRITSLLAESAGTAEVQLLHEGAVLWPAVPGGGLGEARGILRGEAEEKENARSGLIALFVD